MKSETNADVSIKNFKRCIRLLIMSNNGVNGLYAPPSPRYVDGMPIVFVCQDPEKPYKRMPIDKISGYDGIQKRVKESHRYNLGIDYALFNYTKCMKSIDDIITNHNKRWCKNEY